MVQVKWGIDLSSEHERYLAERVFKSPVIVYNYPKDIKVAPFLDPGSWLSSSASSSHYLLLVLSHTWGIAASSCLCLQKSQSSAHLVSHRQLCTWLCACTDAERM